MITRLDLITLDLDNTLWDSDDTIARAHRAMCNWIITEEPASRPLIESDDVWRTARARIARERHDIRHHPSLMRKAITHALLEPLALSAERLDHIVNTGFQIFHEGRNRVSPYPEAIALLDYLKPRIPVIAITNGNSDLARIGLAGHFTGIVSAESAGVAKPHRGIFEAALAITGTAAQHALHVGDHPDEDIAAARALGFRTLWIARPGHEIPPGGTDFTATTPDDMRRQIEALMESSSRHC